MSSPKPWKLTQAWGGFAQIVDANGELVFAIAYPSLKCGDKMPTEQIEENAAELERCLNGARSCRNEQA